MACTVEANGVTLTCACSGCGIAYNHSTKKYHILCCGTITETTLSVQVKDPVPDRPGHVSLDLAGVTLLQAAQLLDIVAPGKGLLPTSAVKGLARKVSMKGTMTLGEFASRARLQVRGKLP